MSERQTFSGHFVDSRELPLSELLFAETIIQNETKAFFLRHGNVHGNEHGNDLENPLKLASEASTLTAEDHKKGCSGLLFIAKFGSPSH